ncbi:unnamed protein product [Spirodela intermedia]|uniref:Uncharacterized protein n=1 Tax=Spirodela intermedia TaxID=51605 RepID=A0A7I8L275_SPIIN|nr:unnamed protein product [Spirodela intermedia]
MGITQTAPLVLLLALLLAVTSLSSADLYGNPPPPFAVKGKTFPPESTLCIDPSKSCFGQSIKCPDQCPMARPADPKAKACFIDCNSPKCEATCRSQKPDCEGNGAACYDPRFVGGDGIMFYFHGRAGHYFTLVSDSTLQVNARFIGHRPPGRTRDFTWIQALGLMFDAHTFTVGATNPAVWDGGVDRLEFSYDGAPVWIHEGHLSTWTSPDGKLEVERTARVNSVAVTLPGVFEITVSVVPVTKEDDRIHSYRLPDGDCFAHMEVQFRFFELSDKAEGVLGQTYRPDFRSPVKRGVPMPVMGGEDKYTTSSLLSSDCKYCIFSPVSSTAAEALMRRSDDAAAAWDCTGRMSDGYGTLCRR